VRAMGEIALHQGAPDIAAGAENNNGSLAHAPSPTDGIRRGTNTVP
jgi:hypothetical protein